MINPRTADGLGLGSAEVAERLGVKLDTVYAYVSRGLLARRIGPDGRSRFDAMDVERLAARGRAPGARTAAHRPVVVASSLTTLSDDAFAYRGHDVVGLCAGHTFEQVAELLWSGPAPAPAPGSWTAPAAASALAHAVLATLPAGTRPFDRLRVVVAAVGASDELRSETSPAAVTAVGRSLIATLVDALAGPAGSVGSGGMGSIAGRLAAALATGRVTEAQVGLVDTALVLAADQGLVPSTVAARVAASVQADPYSVVVAGLGAIAGRLHGAACLGAEELLDEVARTGSAAAAIGARLRRGERIPGFGEARYPGGDPRAVLLLDRLADAAAGDADAAAVARAHGVVEVMASRDLPRPNVDFALAALTHATALRPGSSEALIAIARCAGWLAHALEEYAHPSRFELDATAVPTRPAAP